MKEEKNNKSWLPLVALGAVALVTMACASSCGVSTDVLCVDAVADALVWEDASIRPLEGGVTSTLNDRGYEYVYEDVVGISVPYDDTLSSFSLFYAVWNGFSFSYNVAYWEGVSIGDPSTIVLPRGSTRLFSFEVTVGIQAYVRFESYECLYAFDLMAEGYDNYFSYYPYGRRFNVTLPFGGSIVLDGFSCFHALVGGDYSEGYEVGYNKGRSDGNTEGYNAGYYIGYNKGQNEGDAAGFDRGYTQGAADGYLQGLHEGQTSTGFFADMAMLFGKVITLPVETLIQVFNFEVFGVNMADFAKSLITIVLVLFVVRLALNLPSAKEHSDSFGNGDKISDHDLPKRGK